jgi:hypothetical protein
MARLPTAPATAEPALDHRVEARSNGHGHLLRNGVEAHELTHEDRAKGGRARAEKFRKRRELREELSRGCEAGWILAETDRTIGIRTRHAGPGLSSPTARASRSAGMSSIA